MCAYICKLLKMAEKPKAKPKFLKCPKIATL